jgi:hypothetical protein
MERFEKAIRVLLIAVLGFFVVEWFGSGQGYAGPASLPFLLFLLR